MIPGSHISTAKDSQSLNQEIKVRLTLLDLAGSVGADDGKAKNLVRLVEDDVLREAIPTRKFLTAEIPTWEEIQFIQRQVLRFLQPKDKYAAFASALLKSKAFHHSIQKATPTSTGFNGRKVVDLPRTEHKKPYIPVSKKIRSELDYGGNEEDMYPISISHQHPFVGIAQLDMDTNCGMEAPILVGMDIVVFDDYNRQCYSNQEEFLDVFRDSFTDREWSLIQAQSVGRLQEFYIRWSMKEAYTKALGVGMGLDFSSFDLLLPGDIDNEGESSGVFASINTAGKQLYRQRGTYENLKNEKDVGCWDFAFLPLYEPSSLETPRGCACICAGPLPPRCRSQHLDVCVDWTDLSSLVDWHRTVT
jgi:phosphopantetheine--protein transferase-like protein